MIKRKLSKYLLSIGAMLVVLAVVVPSVAAYEGHLIDIKAHDTIPVTKEARLAYDYEIQKYPPPSCSCGDHDCNGGDNDCNGGDNDCNGGDNDCNGGDNDCNGGDNDCNGGDNDCNPPSLCKPCVYNPSIPGWDNIKDWNRIPKDTCVAWIVNIYVKNPRDYTMYNVKIFDEFNENVKIKKISASPDNVNIQDGNRVDFWNIGTLNPGDTACLTLIVWTKCECNWERKCVSSIPLSSPPLNLGCGLFNLFHGLFNQGSNCDDGCNWKWVCVCHCKNLKQSSNGKYYLQAVHTCGPCTNCGPCPPCEPTGGILMKWKYDNENGQRVPDSYTGGQLLEITVY